jgi:hypothetical protein
MGLSIVYYLTKQKGTLFALKHLTRFSEFDKVQYKETVNDVVRCTARFGAFVVDGDGAWLFLEGR